MKARYCFILAGERKMQRHVRFTAGIDAVERRMEPYRVEEHFEPLFNFVRRGLQRSCAGVRRAADRPGRDEDRITQLCVTMRGTKEQKP